MTGYGPTDGHTLYTVASSWLKIPPLLGPGVAPCSRFHYWSCTFNSGQVRLGTGNKQKLPPLRLLGLTEASVTFRGPLRPYETLFSRPFYSSRGLYAKCPAFPSGHCLILGRFSKTTVPFMHCIILWRRVIHLQIVQSRLSQLEFYISAFPRKFMNCLISSFRYSKPICINRIWISPPWRRGNDASSCWFGTYFFNYT